MIHPSLFVGIGCSGNKFLVHLTKTLSEYGLELPIFHYLVIDGEKNQNTELPSIADPPKIYHVHTPARKPFHAALADWIAPELTSSPNDTQPDNLRSTLMDLMTRLGDESNLSHAQSILESHYTRHNLEPPDNLLSSKPRIFIISSLLGGTSKGSVIDIAYYLRTCSSWEIDDITGIFLIENFDSIHSANAYATIRELEYYQTKDPIYSYVLFIDPQKCLSGDIIEMAVSLLCVDMMPSAKSKRVLRTNWSDYLSSDFANKLAQYSSSGVYCPKYTRSKNKG